MKPIKNGNHWDRYANGNHWDRYAIPHAFVGMVLAAGTHRG